MALWGSNDTASNSTIFAAAQVNKTPNTANRDSLFGNTTADAFISGTTIGQFGASATEAQASLGSISHSGWVLRTTGTGGRAGRVMTEVLVAGGINGSDGDAGKIPDYGIRINTQPSNASGNATADDVATFTVAAVSVPTGASLSYRWEANTGSGFANAASGTSGNTTATLSVNANTATNQASYRVIISATNAMNVTSRAAKLTVTT